MLSRCLQAQRTLTTTTTANSRLARALLRQTLARKPQIFVPRACLTSVAEEASNKQANGGQKTAEDRERQQRQTRLVSIMIGSAVGFIGGSYVLYKRLTNNRAKAEPVSIKEDQQIDEIGSEVDSGGNEQEPKKKRRSFKARRVGRISVELSLFWRVLCNLSSVVIRFIKTHVLFLLLHIFC